MLVPNTQPRIRDSVTKMDAIERLRIWLDESRPTLGSQVGELVARLAVAWDDFGGSDETAMTPDKLRRLEAPEWCPPVLSFRIERHGAMVAGGSSRAEIQTWVLNFNTHTTSCEFSGWRQIRPQQPRLNVEAIAREIALSAATRDPTDRRLTWQGAGVRVNLNQIDGLATGSAVRSTLTSRRGRFRIAIRNEMATAGFTLDSTIRGNFAPYRFVPATPLASTDEC